MGSQCPTVSTLDSWVTMLGRIASICLLPDYCTAVRSGLWGCCSLGLTRCFRDSHDREASQEHPSLHSQEKFLEGRPDRGEDWSWGVDRLKQQQKPYEFVASEEKTIPRNLEGTG